MPRPEKVHALFRIRGVGNLAALAFDQHVAPLLRSVLAYIKDRRDFDGIDFSTTVRLAPEEGSDGSPADLLPIVYLDLSQVRQSDPALFEDLEELD